MYTFFQLGNVLCHLTANVIYRKNPQYESHQIPKLKHFSSRLTVVFANQSNLGV